MLRQGHIPASKASPAQKMRGLRVVLFQKLFQGYIFCFLGDSFGQCIFEQYARETNLKKKRSVSIVGSEVSLYFYGVAPPRCPDKEMQPNLIERPIQSLILSFKQSPVLARTSPFYFICLHEYRFLRFSDLVFVTVFFFLHLLFNSISEINLKF